MFAGGKSGSVNFYFLFFRLSLNSSNFDFSTVLKKVDGSPVDYVSLDGSSLKASIGFVVSSF